jgi:hypothetical protein
MRNHADKFIFKIVNFLMLGPTPFLTNLWQPIKEYATINLNGYKETSPHC